MNEEFLARAKNAVEQYNLQPDEYCIFGGGSLAIHGLRETNDVDILVTKEAFNRIAADTESADGYLEIGDIDIGYNCIHLTYDEILAIINRAQTIGSVQFATLDDVAMWKKRWGREKDLKDIAIIKKHLNS